MKWQDDKTLKGVLQTKAETFIKCKKPGAKVSTKHFFSTLNMIFFFLSKAL